MNKIEISSLVPGTIAQSDLFSQDEELLIKQGTCITENHLAIMKRRNIYDIFTKIDAEADELHSIMSKKFGELGELDLDEIAQNITDKKNPVNAPKKIVIPAEFVDLQAGQSGLRQLIDSSARAKQLDETIGHGFFPDRPIGQALKSRAVQMSNAERTDEYKSGIKMSYSDAVRQVAVILNSLAEAKPIDGNIIRDIVDSFVKTWLTDRSILLNITHIKPTNNDYLYHHSLNVCILSVNIAAAAGFSERQITEIAIGAVLHDAGMLLIPPEIVKKKGRLTKEEWYEVQKHSIFGLHLIEKVSHLPESASFIAYQTHERENGLGYPRQRSGRFIHNFSKIVQVADVFESLSSPREYRMAYMPYQAMEILIKMSVKKLLSSDYVKAFVSYMSLFPVGSLVELSDHMIAKVIQANEYHFTKPVVSVIADNSGTLLPRNKIYQVDLACEVALQIIRAVEWTQVPDVDLMRGF